MKLLPAFLVSLLFTTTHSAADAIMTPPNLNIEAAIAKARSYAAERGFELRNKFIMGAKYERDMRNDYKRPYWSVRWATKTISKGGGVEVRLYTDGSIEEAYYK